MLCVISGMGGEDFYAYTHQQFINIRAPVEVIEVGYMMAADVC